MSELAITALRFGLLALLWIFVFSVIGSQGRSLQISRPAALSRRKKTKQNAKSATEASPADAPPARALASTLIITEGPLAGQRVPLNNRPLLVGRAQDADLVLDDDYASGRHARLFPQGSRWFLEDLGSTNGTFIGGNQLSRTIALEPGVAVRIGKTVMELQA